MKKQRCVTPYTAIRKKMSIAQITMTEFPVLNLSPLSFSLPSIEHDIYLV